MSYAHGKWLGQVAQRKLTNIGTVLGHCGLLIGTKICDGWTMSTNLLLQYLKQTKYTIWRRNNKEDALEEMEEKAPASAIYEVRKE